MWSEPGDLSLSHTHTITSQITVTTTIEETSTGKLSSLTYVSEYFNHLEKGGGVFQLLAWPATACNTGMWPQARHRWGPGIPALLPGGQCCWQGLSATLTEPAMRGPSAHCCMASMYPPPPALCSSRRGGCRGLRAISAHGPPVGYPCFRS